MVVCIVGTGYVGLVTGVCLAANGHEVRCVDVSAQRVRSIQSGRAPFYEPGLDELLSRVLASGQFSISSDLAAAIVNCQISLIAVGTPSKGEEPDLSFLQTAATQIGSALAHSSEYHVVAVKSTVAPGTTRHLVQELVVRGSGRRTGELGLCMNPEFLREGSAVDDFVNPDRIIVGELDYRSGQAMEELYRCYDCPKVHVSLEEAELTKYASNCLLGTLVSFSNELAALCESTPGADIDKVMDGLHLDHRLNPMNGKARVAPQILTYLRAGVGFGGSCLPKDLNALRTYGRQKGVPTPLLDAVMTINARRPRQIVQILDAATGGLRNRTVALLGLAFKAGTDDLRSSPALALLSLLEKQGARVRAYDSIVTREALASSGLDSIYAESLESALDNADAALVTSVDPEFVKADWEKLASRMRTAILVDGRNAFRKVELPNAIRYYPIGQGGLFNEPIGSAV